MEPSNPIHTLVKLFDAEGITNEEVRTHYLSLESDTVSSNLDS